MGCSNCSSGKNGLPGGCKNNGHCSSGGCNRLNTYDWLSTIEAPESNKFNVVEVSFKNGSRKGFYFNQLSSRTHTGDMVVVEAGNGYDIGQINLSGELVKLQMKKRKVSEDAFLPKVVRKANERDLERYHEARQKDNSTMIRARAIARSLGLEMKIGDVEYQGDKRKATFYYTADGRVDFRELIKHYAREFKVKIEMRQIGARQESARIGGLGSCGRELCCSTWLTDFKSVSTTAARYQNLAINQSKLSGQCGRLKCCLNFELDTYIDALKGFPKNADRLRTEAGTAQLLKTDIFKGIMYYQYRDQQFGKTYALPKERVWEIIELNKKDKKPLELISSELLATKETEQEVGFGKVHNIIELPPEEKKKRRRKKKKGGGNQQKRNKPQQKAKSEGQKDQKNKPRKSRNNRRRKRPNKPGGDGQNKKTE
ncbi:MAG: regulatory iron-sulfur-containing complex subunit RicT [Bacteroidota bacterium]